MSDEDLVAAGEALCGALRTTSPGVRLATRTLSAIDARDSTHAPNRS